MRAANVCEAMRVKDAAPERSDTVRAEAMALLRHNSGFVEPELWVEYAIKHNFRRVDSTRLPFCLDCGANPGEELGQFIHYSTLLRLLVCSRCSLVWADARIDPDVVQRHFEAAYKDDAYFEVERQAAFSQLAAIVSRLARPGARVLDIGGAKGHLMHHVAQLRNDLSITIHDISAAATAAAAERYGFATICGDTYALARHGKRYGVVVLSDVVYYEPDVRALWSMLSELVEHDGSVVIRVPNKLWYIQMRQTLFALRRARSARVRQDFIGGFNPEHVTVMHRRYLERRLRSLGFRSIAVMPSRLTCKSRLARKAESVLWRFAQVTSAVSGRRLIVTPAMVIVGSERASPDSGV